MHGIRKRKQSTKGKDRPKDLQWICQAWLVSACLALNRNLAGGWRQTQFQEIDCNICFLRHERKTQKLFWETRPSCSHITTKIPNRNLLNRIFSSGIFLVEALPHLLLYTVEVFNVVRSLPHKPQKLSYIPNLNSLLRSENLPTKLSAQACKTESWPGKRGVRHCPIPGLLLCFCKER